MVDKVGRRPLFLTAISGMVIAFTLWTIMAAMYDKTNHENGFGIAQIVFVWVFGIFYDIGFSGLLVAYTLEVLPFHLRAKGVFIMNITVQATLALGGQTNQLAWDNLPAHWNFCLFYTVRLPPSSFSLPLRSPALASLLCSILIIRVSLPCSSGTLWSGSGSTSSSLRPRALPSRRSPRSSTARTPLLTWT
jgi:hypothetical protein